MCREVQRDYCLPLSGDYGLSCAVTEEAAPVNEPVCVVGTYDAGSDSMTGIRPRFGPNLIVYRGSVDEVLIRVGGDVVRYTRWAAIMIAAGAAALVFALLPAEVSTRVPLIDRLVVT